ncbi:MAG: hypothetical protein L3K17_03230 [Thermoplasmata archaeon]|nr:hypothetical protein [Thermoplasmata archaeon]
MTPESNLAATLARLRVQATSPAEDQRLAAVVSLQALLDHDFDAVFDGTQEWVLDQDEHLREVACRACLPTRPELEDFQARRLLGRLELFIGDQSPTVNAACAGEAIPALIGANPTVGVPWIKEWTHNNDVPVRATMAMALAGLAGRFPADAIEGLSELHTDPRPVVRQAVADSVALIQERQPALRHALETRFGPGASDY